MAPISTPVQKPPAGRLLRWGRELTAVGTPPTGQTGQPIIVESITNFDSADQRDIYSGAEMTGAMSDTIGQDELTHYVQGTITSPFRAHGITAQALACLMGNQTYTPAGGSAPYTHTIPLAPNTNRTNTLTLWWQTTTDPLNPANFIKQYTRMTVTSVALTFGPGGALDTTVSVWGAWPTYQPPPAGFTASSTTLTGSTATNVLVTVGTSSQFQNGPVTITGMTGSPTITAINTTTDALTVSGGTGTPTVGGAVTQTAGVTTPAINYVGNDPVYTITRSMGYQGSFTIYGSSGAAYAVRVLSGTLTVSRPSEAVYAADSQTIVDIALGPLSITGSFVFQFDGYAPGTIARDYSDFKPSGSAANKNILKWTDADGNFTQFTSYFWKWNPFTLDFSGQYVKGNGTFIAYNDPATVMAASPVLTVLNPLTLRNNIATAMVAP